jgi:hypothetical protein
MIINWIWISMMIPVHSRSTSVIKPQTSISYSLCFCDTCNIRDLIIGISIPSSISLPTLPFTRSRDIPSPWPSHMLQHWMKSHRVGLEYLSVTRKNKSRSWCIRLNIDNLVLWKKLWAIIVTGKMKFTLWRFIHDCLPSDQQLRHRKIPVSDQIVYTMDIRSRLQCYTYDLRSFCQGYMDDIEAFLPGETSQEELY